MTTTSRAIALVAGLVTAGTLLPAGTGTAVVAIAGTVTAVVGSVRRSQTATGVGGALLLGSIVLAGAQGLGPQLLVLATVAAIVAWDSAVTAVSLCTQVDDGSETRRVEAVHTGLILVAAAGVGGVVTVAYTFGEGVAPAAAALPVVVGAVLVAAGLGPRLAD